MITRDQSPFVITLLRLDFPLTEEDVLAECKFWGVDPDPVMLLVMRRAPHQSFEYRRGPDGNPYPHVERDDYYTDIRWDRVWLGTPAMKEAMALVQAVRPLRIQSIEL